MDRSWFFFDYLYVCVVAKTAVYEPFSLFSFFPEHRARLLSLSLPYN